MLKRIACIAAVGALAAACASNPAASTSMTTTSSGAVVLTPGAASAGTATVSNIAATTAWMAEEKLMPQDPVLALVNATGGSVDVPQGISFTCNAANGKITAHLGKQSASRIGQTATYNLRAGPGAPRPVEGVFKANKKSPDADFDFPVQSSEILAIAQLDIISVLTDSGEVQWAFVKDPATKVQAKYIASLKNLTTAGRDFIEYCNPK